MYLTLFINLFICSFTFTFCREKYWTLESRIQFIGKMSIISLSCLYIQKLLWDTLMAPLLNLGSRIQFIGILIIDVHNFLRLFVYTEITLCCQGDNCGRKLYIQIVQESSSSRKDQSEGHVHWPSPFQYKGMWGT